MRLTMVLVEIRSSLPGFSGHYSEGVASIAATTRRAGHHFELIHVARPLSPKRLATLVAKTKPDLIGFSSMTNTFSYVQRYVPVVKSMLAQIPIVLGGVHAILSPEESIAVQGVDAVCVGEGEEVVVSMLESVRSGGSFQNLSGLWIRTGANVVRNANRPLLDPLDDLPMPDRTAFNFSELMSTREGVLYVLATRGCPYACRFCCNKAIRSRFPNPAHFVRFKSVDRVLDEIETARRSFPDRLRGVYFQDEILPLHAAWFEAFVGTYPRRVAVPFNCNLRADMVTEELAGQLRAAGCHGISMGLESGVERIRRTVLGKNIDDSTYRNAVYLLRKAGIRVNTFSMVGLPGETAEDALATVRMNAELGVDRAFISIFCPYPGTPLHEDCVAQGIFHGSMPDTYQQTTPLSQPTITGRQVRFVHDHFERLVWLTRGAGLRRRAAARAFEAVRSDAPALAVLSRSKRMLRWGLSGVYIRFARFLVNRQWRMFSARPTGGASTPAAQQSAGFPSKGN